MNKKYFGFIVAATAIFGSLGGVVLNAPEAQAGCGRLDPTCRSGPGDCLFGACPKPSGSKVPSDMTPPKEKTARDLINKGYSCVQVQEYGISTCNVPGGMNPAAFSSRREAFWGAYLGNNRGWAWDCLNKNGQVWGASNGALWCQPGMR